ncbi:DNA cytosine methyltransferase [Cellulophaga baltica]|uniref:DNA cytosine methyltransferase n=1 Tax=Cellulophaga baltica TaxID=76594 RepID=UPI002493F751|nr:DNA cytosine methyltransferase [Cellulophaga baltica]
MKYNFIDLFAGAGGLSEGFIKNDFKPIAHIEIDEAACYTLKTRAAFHYLKKKNLSENYNSYLKGEINRVELYKNLPPRIIKSVINKSICVENNEEIFKKIDSKLNNKEVDLIVGGPPCQAYSLAGRARSENNMKKDPRNFLYVQYANYLEKYNPKMFVFENVLGLKSAGGGVYLSNMERLFNKKGYKINIFKVKAENFGVLQKRRRLIIIGWKDDFTPNLPDLENYNSGIISNVDSLFEDLPELQAGTGTDKYSEYITHTNEYLETTKIRNGIDFVTQHIARPHSEQDKLIYKIAVDKWNTSQERLNYNDLPEKLKTHNNTKSFTDRFKIVAGNINASQTVVAHIAKDGHYYIHPNIEQNRSISVREAARLQSFDDDFYFEGVREGANRTAAFKQIGNAVPPLLANTIAKSIKQLL